MPPSPFVEGGPEWLSDVRRSLKAALPTLRRRPRSKGEGASIEDGGLGAVYDVPQPTTRLRRECVGGGGSNSGGGGCGGPRGGSCNFELGACRCPLHLSGARCETFTPARCGDESNFGYVSRCAGACDQTLGKCRCGVGRADVGETNVADRAKVVGDGNGTEPGYVYDDVFDAASSSRYPDRPMMRCYYDGVDAEQTWHHVGWDAWAHAPKRAFWRPWHGRPGETDGAENMAWCNAAPSPSPTNGERRMGTINVGCQCFDGYVGDFCQERVRQFCLNDCAHRGACVHGHCRCDPGYFGADCSQLEAGGIAPVGAGSGVGVEGTGRNGNGASVSASRAMDGRLFGTEADAMDGGTRARQLSESLISERLERGGFVGLADEFAGGSHDRRRRRARRPLVYVYDLDPRFTTAQLQQRADKWKCTTRSMESGNTTRFVDTLYGVETALHELLLDSPHRTEDPELADFFFVPVYHFCFISRIQTPVPDHSYLKYQNELGPSCGMTHADVTGAKLFVPLMRHVMEDFPFWNRSGGADHLVPFLHDEGACYAPKEVANATLLVHWGRHDLNPEPSTAFSYHAWATKKEDKDESCPVRHAALLAGHEGRCYRPGRDIVLPPWRDPSAFDRSPLLRAESDAVAAALTTRKRKPLHPPWTNLAASAAIARVAARASAGAAAKPRDGPFFLFRGEIRMDSRSHSAGLRQEAHRFYGPGKAAAAGGDVIVDGPAGSYREELASAVFCGVFPGDGWSARFEDAVLNGCVPVVVQDDVHVAWEGYLDVSALSVRFSRHDIPTMVARLREMPPERLASLRLAGARAWHRFAWLGYFAGERARVRAGLSRVSVADEARLEAIGRVQGADALETLLTVLRHKLVRRGEETGRGAHLGGRGGGAGSVEGVDGGRGAWRPKPKGDEGADREASASGDPVDDAGTDASSEDGVVRADVSEPVWEPRRRHSYTRD